jgi:hypothetical protein
MSDNELDVAEFFKQEASDLASVSDLNGTLQRFGFSNDDRIERRELVMMYRAVSKEMEKEIFNQANSNRYEGAKEMRSRLTNIRNEFDSLQTSGVKTNQRDQTAHLESAIRKLNINISRKHDTESQILFNDCSEAEEEQRNTNRIEQENLELQISRVPVPSVKYSKRAIELMKAETGLTKLNQYDDARKVRMMLDRLLPGEEAKFQSEFDAKIEHRRTQLKAVQAQKSSLLVEKLKGKEWTDCRRKERELEVSIRRVSHHGADMNHAHVMEQKLRSELTVTSTLAPILFSFYLNYYSSINLNPLALLLTLILITILILLGLR